MRDQYAGDISDLLKLSLLRALAAADRSLGVAWYFNPDDSGPDGGHRGYRNEAKWQSLDSAVWSALRELPDGAGIAALEKLSLWPRGTRFHGVSIVSAERRELWAQEMKNALEGSDIMFLDPDNGPGETEKHATIGEIRKMMRPGRAVVFIKFPGRQEHGKQLADYHQWLLTHLGATPIITVTTRVWLCDKRIPSFRWFTIIGADSALTERARRFAETLDSIKKCQSRLVCAAAAAGRPESICPECGHRFKGKGLDGIDAHWKAKHEAIMPYREAWPLLKAGTYRRK